MNYSQFLEMITKEVRERVDPLACIRISRIQKMNRSAVDGMTILMPGENTAPAIYLDSFFEEYQGGTPLPVLAEEILAFHRENSKTTVCDLSFYTDFSQAKNRITCRLVNYEMNQALLKDVPHRRFLDLAIVYYYEMEDSVFGNSAILVRNSHLQIWEINPEHLDSLAIKNTRLLLPFRVTTMNELSEEIAGFPRSLCLSESPSMYILTNRNMAFGAVNIIYDDILGAIAEKLGGDFYVLPSSIHECLILPVCSWNDEEPQRLKDIVTEINQKYVSAEEILGDHVYRYVQSAKKLSLAA